MERQVVNQRIRRLKESMGDLDAVVASSLENTYYFSGSHIMTIRAIPDRLALLLVPKNGDPTFLVCVIEESLVRKESSIEDVRPYIEFEKNPVDMLGATLDEKGLADAAIGFESRHLSAMYRERLSQVAPGATWRPFDHGFARIRAIKSKPEIDLLVRGAGVTERAIWDSWDGARVGQTERAIAIDMAHSMLSRGIDIVSFLCMGAGTHCGDAHPSPGSRKLRKGDVIRCDVGGLYQRYQTDVARTGVIGKPTPKQTQRYDAIYEAQRRVIEAMKPGTPASKLFHLAAETIRSRGYPFTAPHIGHSIGIGLHEEPMLQPYNEMTLEENMVFYVEPFMRTGPRDAYHVEDLVRVTPDGGLLLTDPEGLRTGLYVL
jgi:Xaa-Pro dipeptidase